MTLFSYNSDIRALLTPFWDDNFDPEFLPTLSWPQLMHLKVRELEIPWGYDHGAVIKCMLIAVGRALRQMPRL